MKVSHTVDFATSAVIGSQEVSEMGISNNQEFMQILASTLYTYPMIAFIRETLSNHWDAHIEAGKTDTPIKVEVTDTYYMVKDFGYGIADDKFSEVYGTFGKGTKENDPNSIGGFGLGCKSPLAYTDAFEVTSCHNGVKSVYSIVKASRQANNKNAIIRLVQVPTEETGLTVKVPIRASDRVRITGLVESYVYAGNMLCELNNDFGELLPTIGINFEPEQCCIVEDTLQQISCVDYLNTSVLIRYANILYPLAVKRSEYPELYDCIKEIEDFLPNINRYRESYAIIQAHPNSLSLNPSRESISMTDYSVDALNKLVKAAYTNLLVQYDKTATKLHTALVKELKSLSLSQLVSCWSHVHPLKQFMRSFKDKVINDLNEDEKYLFSVWSDRATEAIHEAVAKELYLKYAHADIKYKEVRFDIALLNKGKLNSNTFSNVYRKIIKLVDALGLKHISYYWLREDYPVSLDKLDDSNLFNFRRVYETLQRKVVIARTVKELNQSTQYIQNALLIRYHDAANRAKLIAALIDAGVNYQDVSEAVPEKVTTKRVLPKVADYLDGVPTWLAPETFTTDVDVIVVKRPDGYYTDISGISLRRKNIGRLADIGVKIGVVPNLTIAKSLSKRWDTQSLTVVAPKAMQQYWEDNRKEWVSQTRTIDSVIDAIRPVYMKTACAIEGISHTNNRINCGFTPVVEYLETILNQDYKNFKYSYPSRKYAASVLNQIERWPHILRNLNLSSVWVSAIKDELVKPITLDELPSALIYRVKATALWQHWRALDYDTFTDDPLFMSFIDKQLRKLENEYKNKRGSSSRNYGYYYPVQARR